MIAAASPAVLHRSCGDTLHDALQPEHLQLPIRCRTPGLTFAITESSQKEASSLFSSEKVIDFLDVSGVFGGVFAPDDRGIVRIVAEFGRKWLQALCR